MRRHELTDFEWRIIEPLLPNKPRGVPRVNDRVWSPGVMFTYILQLALSKFAGLFLWSS
jgi:transposase